MGGHVGQGYFLLDQHIAVSAEGVRPAPEAAVPLPGNVDAFAGLLNSYRPVTVALR